MLEGKKSKQQTSWVCVHVCVYFFACVPVCGSHLLHNCDTLSGQNKVSLSKQNARFVRRRRVKKHPSSLIVEFRFPSVKKKDQEGSFSFVTDAEKKKGPTSRAATSRCGSAQRDTLLHPLHTRYEMKALKTI